MRGHQKLPWQQVMAALSCIALKVEAVCPFPPPYTQRCVCTAWAHYKGQRVGVNLLVHDLLCAPIIWLKVRNGGSCWAGNCPEPSGKGSSCTAREGLRHWASYFFQVELVGLLRWHPSPRKGADGSPWAAREASGYLQLGIAHRASRQWFW